MNTTGILWRLAHQALPHFAWELVPKRREEPQFTMDVLGFRCADLADPMLCLQDGMRWQLDLVFLPKSDLAFSVKHYA